MTEPADAAEIEPRPSDVEARNPSPPNHRDELIAAIAGGGSPRWLFFWGHTAPSSGAIGKHVLSQWWPAPFEVDGVTYPTAEHWMMAAKARLFGDAEAERMVMAAAHPGAAKTAGRRVEGFDDSVWVANRFEIVVAGNVAKFGRHRELRKFLTGTGQRVLVEASPRDRLWGIGLPASHPDATDPTRWRGANLLGFALMEARARLLAAARH